MHLEGWTLWTARIAAIAAIAGAIVAIEATIAPERSSGSSPAPAATGATSVSGKPDAASTSGARTAPEIREIAAWINSEPLALSDLRGKVVLIDFWAYSCINCIRTVPHLREWHSKYSPRGLVMIGLHAPEFEFERVEENVRDAVLKQGITWPVGLDNGFATWNAYGNRYWPRKYLIDRDGVIRYNRIGEGGYVETERQIRKLLVEAGASVDDIPIGGADDRPIGGALVTRELYAGYGWASGGFLGNAGDAPHDR
ncbi:MAG: redoxin domain-containing protein, partial [Chloroflexi bacterium]|nr:redoxin domain-containing protein [Chloroflexota bacterium]